MKTLKTTLILFLLSSPFIFIDLYSKHLANKFITSEDKEIIIYKDIKFGVPVVNKGFAFQNLDSVSIWHRGASKILLFALCILLLFAEGGNIFDRVVFTIFRGGALGNAIDLFFLGGVTDFIHIYPTADTYYVLNFADIFVTLSAGFLIFQGLGFLFYYLGAWIINLFKFK